MSSDKKPEAQPSKHYTLEVNDIEHHDAVNVMAPQRKVNPAEDKDRKCKDEDK